MILWMPRMSRDGRYVVGFRPGPNESSAVVILDRESGAERMLDPDGTGPVWCRDEILVRPQSAAAVLRRYGADGTLRGTIALPAPANSVEADDEGRWASYLGPPYGPRVVMGTIDDEADRFAPAGAYVSPAPCGAASWLAARHDTGAYVALVYDGRRWVASVSGRLVPEIGTAYDVAGREGYVVIAREPGQLVVVHLSDPLHGWIVAEGDVRYPDLALVHELALDVVWCNGRGELGHARVDLTTPQVDLRVDAPPAPVETWEPGAYRVAPRGVVGEWRDRRGALPPARPASLRGRVRADARVDQR